MKIQTLEKRECWENSKVVGSADDSEQYVKNYTFKRHNNGYAFNKVV
jgi:hypothetical protein